MIVATNISKSGADYPCAKEGCETPVASGQIYCSRHKPKPDSHPFKMPYTIAGDRQHAASKRAGRGRDVALPGSWPKLNAQTGRGGVQCPPSPTGSHWRDCAPSRDESGVELQVCRFCGDVKRIVRWEG